MTGERPRNAELFFEVVVLSLVNQLVFLTLSAAVRSLPAPTGVPAPSAEVLFLAEVLLLPMALGALFGLNLRRGWDRALLRRLSMPVQHPVRTGYDFAFAEGREPCFVLISFRDGHEVRGWFGENSLAASDTSRGDIYLERVYDVGEDGTWVEPNPARAAYVSLDDVRAIEFLETPGA